MKFSASATLFALAVQSASAFTVVPSSGGFSTQLYSDADTAAPSEFDAEGAGLDAVELPPIDIFDTPEQLPGIVDPLGFWDPLDFAGKADNTNLRRYREAEITHGRVGMLAVLGT